MSELFVGGVKSYKWIQPYVSDRKPHCQYEYMSNFYYDYVELIELVCKNLWWFDKLAIIPTDRIV